MFLKRYGTGPKVYLGLHGWGNDGNVFAPLAQSLPSGASFFSADLPGFGASERPEEWSVNSILDEVNKTALALDSGPVTIVGHCGGAAFALFAARDRPELFPRVVAIDPFAYLPRYFRVFTGKRLGRRAYNATFANPVGRWVTNKALNAGREGQTDLTSSFGVTDHEVARRYLSLFETMGSVDELRELQAAVDLVYGERTFGAVKRSVRILAEALPQARTWVLTSARHMPLEEATAQLAQIIFLPDEAKGQVLPGNQTTAHKESGVEV